MALTIGVPMGSPTRLWASLLLFPRYASMASDLAEVYSPTKRESACRSYIAHWAAQGSVDMGLACRRVYTEVACTAAVTALGGSWPDASEASSNAEAVAAAACQAVERQLYNRRGLMLNQQAAKRHEGSGPAGRRSLSLLAAGAAARQGSIHRELPTWVADAPVMWEDPEATESPFPLQSSPSSWDGPRLTMSSMDILINQWGGTYPPSSIPGTTVVPPELSGVSTA